MLRLFESNEVTAPQVLPGGAGVPQPLPSNGGHWDQDQVRIVLSESELNLRPSYESVQTESCIVLFHARNQLYVILYQNFLLSISYVVLRKRMIRYTDPCNRNINNFPGIFRTLFNCNIHLQSYFSEPEFDSEYQHQHIHKGKVSKFP